MKKYLIATVAIAGVFMLEGCISTGMAHLGDGKVAVNRSLIWPVPVPLKPKIYDCSSGTGCVAVQ